MNKREKRAKRKMIRFIKSLNEDERFVFIYQNGDRVRFQSIPTDHEWVESAMLDMLLSDPKLSQSFVGKINEHILMNLAQNKEIN